MTDPVFDLPALQYIFEEKLHTLDQKYGTAIIALQKRVDDQNHIREALSDQAATYMQRSESETKLNNIIEKIDEHKKQVEEKLLSYNKKPFWFIGLMTPFIIAGMTALWSIINNQITYSSGTLQITLQQIHTEAQNRDKSIGELAQDLKTISSGNQSNRQSIIGLETNYNQVNQRTRDIEQNMATGQADRKAADASFKAALIEIEQQECQQDNIRNLTHATDLRTMTLMWNRLKMGDYPSSTVYYPEVCNKNLYAMGTGTK